MQRRGFTLIELLVVIAIIGMLSSVVLASLNSARGKARDASVRQSVLQMRNLFELEYSDTGSYQRLKVPSGATYGWFSSAAQCASAPFAGPYADQAKSVCAAILNAQGSVCATEITCLYIVAANPNSPTNYSIMARLPGSQRFFCVGSSGSVSTTAGDPWLEPGCHSNP